MSVHHREGTPPPPWCWAASSQDDQLSGCLLLSGLMVPRVGHYDFRNVNQTRTRRATHTSFIWLVLQTALLTDRLWDRFFLRVAARLASLLFRESQARGLLLLHLRYIV